MADTKATGKSVRIHEGRDRETQFLFHPDDNDLFMRTGQQVINACRLDISVELWMSEIKSMLQEVREWSGTYSEKVRSCHCVPRSSQLVLFFCPTADEFDFDLADELVTLNLHLQQTYNVGMVETQQIPWGEAQRFLYPEMASWVYGDGLERSSQPMEA